MTSFRSSDTGGNCNPNFPNFWLADLPGVEDVCEIQLRYWSVQSLVLVTTLQPPLRIRQVSTTMHFWLKCWPSKVPIQSPLEVMIAKSPYIRGAKSGTSFFSIVMCEKRLSSHTGLGARRLPFHAYNAYSGAMSSSSFFRSFLLVASANSFERRTSLASVVY